MISPWSVLLEKGEISVIFKKLNVSEKPLSSRGSESVNWGLINPIGWF